MAAERKSGSVGSTLRDARERRGISLRQIAGATKISMNALEALERDDISRLPGGIFSRAFVRSYAVEVGLDPEDTLQRFIAQFPEETAVQSGPIQSEEEDAHESNRRTANVFVRMIVVSAPIAAAMVYLSGVGRVAREPADDRADGIEPVVERAHPTAAAAPPPAAPVPSPPAPAAERAPARPPTPPAAEKPPPAVAPAAGDAATDTPAERITVALVATAPCWVSVIVDGERIVSREFQAGERATFDAQRDVLLTAGDASALDVTLNGADARPLGPSGQMVTVRVTPANFKDYLASP